MASRLMAETDNPDELKPIRMQPTVPLTPPTARLKVSSAVKLDSIFS